MNLKTLALLPYTQAGSHRAARADAAMASNGHSSAGTPARRSLRLFALASAALSLVACGTSSSSRPQVGAIAFTDANGNALPAVTALNAGSGAYLEVLVTQDPQMLGVNWSVSCSSKLPPGTPLPPGQTVDESCRLLHPCPYRKRSGSELRDQRCGHCDVLSSSACTAKVRVGDTLRQCHQRPRAIYPDHAVHSP